MKITCTKEEYRSMILGCAEASRVGYCSSCGLALICEHECDPGDWLSEHCEIVPEEDKSDD